MYNIYLNCPEKRKKKNNLQTEKSAYRTVMRGIDIHTHAHLTRIFCGYTQKKTNVRIDSIFRQKKIKPHKYL